MITQELLKELLHYDPDTGIFTWLPRDCPKFRHTGKPVGSEFVADCGKRYRHTNLFGSSYLLHRLAFLYMLGRFPPSEVDHLNGNGLDNRFENLREVTRQGNTKNKRKHANNSSGHTGIHWYPRYGKWCARIGVNGKKVCLGYFSNLQDAVNTRKDAEILHQYHTNHGDARPL